MASKRKPQAKKNSELVLPREFYALEARAFAVHRARTGRNPKPGECDCCKLQIKVSGSTFARDITVGDRTQATHQVGSRSDTNATLRPPQPYTADGSADAQIRTDILAREDLILAIHEYLWRWEVCNPCGKTRVFAALTGRLQGTFHCLQESGEMTQADTRLFKLPDFLSHQKEVTTAVFGVADCYATATCSVSLREP